MAAFDLPDMSGRVCVVTGANTGIGRVTALELARRGAHVILACRSQAKTQPVIDAIVAETGNTQVEFLALDLARFDAIRASAQVLLARDLPIHLLVNNAGLAGVREVSPEGYELMFAVNHLGTFLFTLLLAERIVASAPARIVTVASKVHLRAKGIPFEQLQQPARSLTGMGAYAVSKLGNVLFSRTLSQRLAGTGVTTYALHPGVVATDIWRKIPWPFDAIAKRFMITVEQGAATTLYCATAPELTGVSGRYYDECREAQPSALAQDDALAAALWARSLVITGAPDLSAG
ncbi:MAG: SDR family oxidoreductase [Polyangiales bacterium]|nr:SDR family oxidoreductase [Myxococcales bacterium]